MEINIAYINSTMNEIHELSNELYEALTDNDPVCDIVRRFKTTLSDIQKSYDRESQN